MRRTLLLSLGAPPAPRPAATLPGNRCRAATQCHPHLMKGPAVLFSREIRAIRERDPASRSTIEAILTSSGLHAIAIHRVAHWLWRTHMIVGIGWIGTSFYFMALDYGLDTKERKSEGVYGTAWQVHGGGFYHVEKFTVAPPQLPAHLHWFKWDAYLTWVTGFGLLVVQYYLHAQSYLIDPSVMPLESWQAIAISVASLLAGWVIYEALCRSPIGKQHRAAGALRVRADPGRLGALHQGVFGARRVPACRRLRRHHHGVQRVHGDHPEPAQDGGAAASPERRPTRAMGDRQAALDPQQLSDAAGAGDDGVAALSVPLGASAGLAGRGADHRRRAR